MQYALVVEGGMILTEVARSIVTSPYNSDATVCIPVYIVAVCQYSGLVISRQHMHTRKAGLFGAYGEASYTCTCS